MKTMIKNSKKLNDEHAHSHGVLVDRGETVVSYWWTGREIMREDNATTTTKAPLCFSCRAFDPLPVTTRLFRLSHKFQHPMSASSHVS